MKLVFFFLVFFSYTIKAQNMSIEKLDEIITKSSDSLLSKNNTWRFIYKNRILICVADKKANRMRIISPIAKKEQLTEELILNSLVANFHTALDVKYALSDEILWSVFTHPLKELSPQQIEDAISQVYYANITFGTLYSSTSLTFPGNTKKKELKKEIPFKEKI
ncbi:hypothetical protein [uncultured Tenacibaculum sp.]|uniref:hypothetical protein n=1 Tax=uncultured Tenacibaculum sp. TaxID=174713 RepID=UPI00260F7D28|nr:hypothetical protein [uncultured Tenacibaculum sp.]